jgi:hypothetical protein
VKTKISLLVGQSIFALLAVLLLNAPFWVLQQHYFVLRPIFNIDLNFVAVICLLNVPIGAALLLFAWVLDGVLVASFSYFFGSVFEFVSTIGYLSVLELYRYLTLQVGVILLMFLLLGSGVLFIFIRRRTSVNAIIIISLIICFFDIINGSTQLFGLGRDQFLVKENIAGSPSLNLWVARNRERVTSTIPLSSLPSPTAFHRIAEWHSRHSEQSVLVVIVESLGRPVPAKLQAWLEDQIFTSKVKSRWRTTSTIESFAGSTTYGELRVLCGLSGHYRRITVENAQKCLPYTASLDGYETTGYHGFTSQMFERSKWWPSIGLNSRYFAESLASSTPMCAGAFPGVCDDAMITLASLQADKPRQFVYLLTLNTHLPLEHTDVPSSFRSLCSLEAFDDLACELVFLLGNTLKNISGNLERVGHPPFVAIVGDHAPPFNDIQSRMSFVKGTVPVYFLEPI